MQYGVMFLCLMLLGFFANFFLLPFSFVNRHDFTHSVFFHIILPPSINLFWPSIYSPSNV